MPARSSPVRHAVLLAAALALVAPTSAWAQSVAEASVTKDQVPTAPTRSAVATPHVIDTPRFAGAPPNDRLDRSISLVGHAQTWVGSNVGARTEPAQSPSASCATGGPDNDGDNSVWYWFVPASNGSVTLDLAGSQFDTILTLLDSNSRELACSDNAPGNPSGDTTSQIADFMVAAGDVYFVRITGYRGAEGQYVLRYHGPATRADYWHEAR
ncbi:MAG: hypothetical protein R3181_13100 [Rubricoccaceae bacterium]|nr:hypothetical protein [Rubricoccaceae bacterium]